MDRRTYSLIAAAAAVLAGSSSAQTPASEPAPTKAQARKQAARAAANSPELENVRKAIEALTPEQRVRFKDNFVRWSNLSPEEKKALRDRSESRSKRMAEDIEQAVQESGLTLDGGQRAAFARRYAQERRQLEEELRRETEQKRQPLVREIVARLKAEFSANAAAPPAGE